MVEREFMECEMYNERRGCECAHRATGCREDDEGVWRMCCRHHMRSGGGGGARERAQQMQQQQQGVFVEEQRAQRGLCAICQEGMLLRLRPVVGARHQTQQQIRSRSPPTTMYTRFGGRRAGEEDDDASEGEEEVVRVDPCGHEYHRRCIDRWFLRKTGVRRTCPCCRQPCSRYTTPLVLVRLRSPSQSPSEAAASASALVSVSVSGPAPTSAVTTSTTKAEAEVEAPEEEEEEVEEVVYDEAPSQGRPPQGATRPSGGRGNMALLGEVMDELVWWRAAATDLVCTHDVDPPNFLHSTDVFVYDPTARTGYYVIE